VVVVVGMLTLATLRLRDVHDLFRADRVALALVLAGTVTARRHAAGRRHRVLVFAAVGVYCSSARLDGDRRVRPAARPAAGALTRSTGARGPRPRGVFAG